jgi:serine protease AprX
MNLKRLAPVLALVVFSVQGSRGAAPSHRAHLSDDLTAHLDHHTRVRERVIVHGSQDTVDAIVARHHLQVLRQSERFAVLAVNSDELDRLAADPAIEHLSGDAEVRHTMSVSIKSTAADQTRTGTSGLLGIGAIAGVTGQGIGVAVIDSGISTHSALSKKVVANVSFVTNDPGVADVYGHGTHVAGIIAGQASAATYVTPLYTGGIAPGAQLINVRVLGGDGSGLTSDVIDGIDWAIANRAKYNIRVINLSLGHPVTESYTTDPLCEAVERAATLEDIRAEVLTPDRLNAVVFGAVTCELEGVLALLFSACTDGGAGALPDLLPSFMYPNTAPPTMMSVSAANTRGLTEVRCVTKADRG